MYVHRERKVTHCPEDGDDTTMDTISYEYRIYGENEQETWVSNKGRDILRAFGWDPNKMYMCPKQQIVFCKNRVI